VDFERLGQTGETDQPEQIDEFERELRQAMERRPAPPSLKRRILQQMNVRRTDRMQSYTVWWQRLAASVLLVGVIAGGYSWRQVEERRKGEEAAQQVLTALRITNRALNDMNRRLVARNRADQ
jgi:plasmid stabilization system protein ParE